MSDVIKRYHNFLGQATPGKITITSIDLPRGNANITDTSVPLTGKDYFNYSPPVVESLFWALGNFASETAPLNPLYGQTWYDSTEKVLKLFIGSDHDNTPKNWVAMRPTELTELPQIIPDYDNLYDIGSASKRFNNLFCNKLNSTSSLIIGTTPLGDLIPSDTANIINKSAVPGDTVKDALRYLNNLEIGDDIAGVENIYIKAGGAINITPSNVRYRVHADKDVTITIDTASPSTAIFQIVLIGMGRMTLLGGLGVTLTQIKSGTFSSFANFTKYSSDIWLVHGNFG